MNFDTVVDLLTRSDRSRANAADKTDEALLSSLVATPENVAWLSIMVEIAKQLRYIDGFLKARHTGEALVERFSEFFSHETRWALVPRINTHLDQLDEYYRQMQLYTASPTDRQAEPLLIGSNDLERVTKNAYRLLLTAWIAELQTGMGTPGQ